MVSLVCKDGMETRRASESDRPLFEVLMQEYLGEMSKFDNIAPDSSGYFDCGEYFPLYWSESNRYPYLFYQGDTVIGFALVRQTDVGTHSVAEFFVRRAFRSQGLAKFFAHSVFELHRGRWQVSQLESNVPAQKFWRSTISAYTNGNFVEGWSEASPTGPMQTFNSLTKVQVASDRQRSD